MGADSTVGPPRAHDGTLLPDAPSAALGLWYATRPGVEHGDRRFASADEVELAYAQGAVGLCDVVRFRSDVTTIGRVLAARAAGVPVPFRLFNRTLVPRARDALIEECAHLLGGVAAARVSSRLSLFGARAAMRSGFSLAADDFAPPTRATERIAEAVVRSESVMARYLAGELTEGERYHHVLDEHTSAQGAIESLVRYHFGPDTALGALLSTELASSSDVRRATCMVGVLDDAHGSPIDTAVTVGLAQGLAPHAYFVTGAATRRSMLDRARREETAELLRTELMRAVGRVVVGEDDCGVARPRRLRTYARFASSIAATVGERALGRMSIDERAVIDLARAEQIDRDVRPSVEIRSLVACRARVGVCRACYGWDPRARTEVPVGALVGAAAACAIGRAARDLIEPRFHIGNGVRVASVTTHGGTVRHERIEAEPLERGLVNMSAEGRISIIDDDGIARERFRVSRGDVIEAIAGTRVPAGTRVVRFPHDELPIVADIPRGATAVVRFADVRPTLDEAPLVGALTLEITEPGVEVRHTRIELSHRPVPAVVMVNDGDVVSRGRLLAFERDATWNALGRSQEGVDGLLRILEAVDRGRAPHAVLAERAGVVEKIDATGIRVVTCDGAETYPRPRGLYAVVWPRQDVLPGDSLTAGHRRLRDVVRLVGREEAAQEVLERAVAIFRDASIPIAEVHLELVVREMFDWARVQDAGDTSYARGEVVRCDEAIAENERAVSRGAKPAQLTPAVRGIGKLATRAIAGE